MADAMPNVKNADGSCPPGYKKSGGDCVPITKGATTLDLAKRKALEDAARLSEKDKEGAARAKDNADFLGDLLK